MLKQEYLISKLFLLQVIRELLSNKLIIDHLRKHGIKISDIHIYDKDLKGLLPANLNELKQYVVEVRELRGFELRDCCFTITFNDNGTISFRDSHGYDNDLVDGCRTFQMILQKYTQCDLKSIFGAFLCELLDENKDQSPQPEFNIKLPALSSESSVRQNLRLTAIRRAIRSTPILRQSPLSYRPMQNLDGHVRMPVKNSSVNILMLVKGECDFSGPSAVAAKLLIIHSLQDKRVLQFLLTGVNPLLDEVRRYEYYSDKERYLLVKALELHDLLKVKKESAKQIETFFDPNINRSVIVILGRRYLSSVGSRVFKGKEQSTPSDEKVMDQIAQYIVEQCKTDPSFLYFAFASYGNRATPTILKLLDNVLTRLNDATMLDSLEIICSFLLFKEKKFNFALLSNEAFCKCLSNYRDIPLFSLLYSNFVETLRDSLLPENLPKDSVEFGAVRGSHSLLRRNKQKADSMLSCICLSEQDVLEMRLDEQSRVKTQAKADWMRYHDSDIKLLLGGFEVFLPLRVLEFPQFHSDFRNAMIGKMVGWDDGHDPSHYELGNLPCKFVSFDDAKKEKFMSDAAIAEYHQNLNAMSPLNEMIRTKTALITLEDVCGFVSLDRIVSLVFGDDHKCSELPRFLSDCIVRFTEEIVEGKKPPAVFCYTRTLEHVTKFGKKLNIYQDDYPSLFLALHELLSDRKNGFDPQNIYVVKQVREITFKWCEQKIAEARTKEFEKVTIQALFTVVKEELVNLQFDFDAVDPHKFQRYLERCLVLLIQNYMSSDLYDRSEFTVVKRSDQTFLNDCNISPSLDEIASFVVKTFDGSKFSWVRACENEANILEFMQNTFLNVNYSLG